VPPLSTSTLDWRGIRVVVFDVDGTLYDQGPLRRRMVREILFYCLARPWKISLLRTIHEFRKAREQLADEEAVAVSRAQYERPASRLGISPAQVEDVVEEWMFERPLPHLRACRYAGVAEVFSRLKEAGRTMAAFSDYPAAKKLQALELEADLVATAMDPEVDRFKPHPAGLLRVIELSRADPAQVLLIGDRDERDGECARRVGCPYLLKVPGAPAGPGTFGSYLELLASIS
jgi:phosphoglycolate phosphatase/putative hydrolase of the HAD superfamily